jgi:HEAT repeat protein/beta-lactam-binding protein with PASTA domain
VLAYYTVKYYAVKFKELFPTPSCIARKWPFSEGLIFGRNFMPCRTTEKKHFKLLSAIAWSLIFVLIVPVPSPGFLPSGHREITTRALARLDEIRVIPQEVRDELIRGSVDPDLTESGLLFTNSRYDPNYHFDNDGDYGKVCANYDALNRLIEEHLAKTDPDPWEFGRILHAIEDFYSHSNYIPLYLEYKEKSGEPKGSAPPIEEIWLDPTRYKEFIDLLRQRLRTGRYPDHGPLPDERDHGFAVVPFVRGMNKDSFVRELNSQARQSAISAAFWYIQLYLRDGERIALWRKNKGTCTLQAAGARATEGPEQSMSIFSNRLRTSPDSEARRLAALSLGHIGDARAVPLLVDALSRDQAASVRKFAAQALGLIGTEAAINPLLDAISPSQSASVQIAAVESLGMIRTKSAQAAVVGLLKSKTRGVRKTALTTLARGGGEGTYLVIRPLLDDSDASVAARAAWALGELRSRLAVQALSETLLKSASAELREQSALALGRIGDEGAIPILREVAGRRNEDGAVRVASTKALGFFKNSSALAALVELLTDPMPEVRAMAAYSSIQLHSHEAVPAIRGLLRDKDPRVRTEVIAAMGQWPEQFSEALGGVVSSRTQRDYDRILGLEGLDHLPSTEEVDVHARRLLDPHESQSIQAAAVSFLKQRPAPANGRALIGFYETAGLGKGIRSMSQVIVPYVGSLDEENAQSRIRGAGLKVGFVRRIPHDKLLAGSIILQIPLYGFKTSIGSSVDLYESSGPYPNDGKRVPDLVEHRVADAKDALIKQDLNPEVDHAYKCPAGETVMFQLPEAGKRVQPGAQVFLFRGGATSKEDVPNFIGWDVREIVKRSKEWPFFFFYRQVESNGNQWEVFAQSPDGGSRVYCGTWVALDYWVPRPVDTPPN